MQQPSHAPAGVVPYSNQNMPKQAEHALSLLLSLAGAAPIQQQVPQVQVQLPPSMALGQNGHFGPNAHHPGQPNLDAPYARFNRPLPPGIKVSSRVQSLMRKVTRKIIKPASRANLLLCSFQQEERLRTLAARGDSKSAPKKVRNKRRKIEEIAEHELWSCPFGCGKVYKVSRAVRFFP